MTDYASLYAICLLIIYLDQYYKIYTYHHHHHHHHATHRLLLIIYLVSVKIRQCIGCIGIIIGDFYSTFTNGYEIGIT